MWQQPKCPLTDKWVKKMWCVYIHIHTDTHTHRHTHTDTYTHTLKYYSAIKRMK